MNSENTMMGLPAGYPSKAQIDKIEKKNKEIRKKSTTDSEYVYNIVDEIADDVNDFIDGYPAGNPIIVFSEFIPINIIK